ncbi:MAG: LemA family protein [Malacoplasma sp.]
MLVNPNVKSNPDGFNPNVDNTVQTPRASTSQNMGWYIMLFFGFLLIIPGIIMLVFSIQYKNYFQRKQIEINNASSTIDVMLAKRRDTLIKLLEQTKSYMKFEKQVLTDITSLRTVGNKGMNQNDAQLLMDKVSKNISLTFENYPDLKSNSVIMELMSSSQYLETELSSARRLYNQNVSEFNSELFIFPKIIFASKMRLTTFPFFQASEIQKQDVEMSSLNDI